jgi:NtrC-family two-component system response regulator AlgB
MKILLIDDEMSLRRTLRTTLESMGHSVAEASNGEAALRLLHEERFDVAFLDLKLGREKGIELLPQLIEASPATAVIIMTAYASIDTAVATMRLGASDYLAKPFTPDQLRVVLDRRKLVQGLKNQVANLEEQVRESIPEVDLNSGEPAMRAILDVASQVAPTEATVLLRGESGTGKGVLARTIHMRSKRASGPFVTIHCPSLSADLLESNLFGHVKGSFTGATRDTEGKVTATEGGTLFLDEIGDLPLALQPKLLRFLQEKAFERIGENITRRGDVRILAATNQDLEAEVAAGRFREDLLYRLNVIEIRLPPLRERPRDVLPLADHLLTFFARQNAKRVVGFTAEARAALERYRWPGNLRELRNAIERGVILTNDEEVGLAQLPVQVGTPVAAARVDIGGAVTLDALEAEHIRRVLSTSPSLDEAAEILGIDPSTLYRKRKRYGL